MGYEMNNALIILFTVPILCIVLVVAKQFTEQMFSNKRSSPVEELDRPTARVQFGIFKPVLESLPMIAMLTDSESLLGVPAELKTALIIH